MRRLISCCFAIVLLALWVLAFAKEPEPTASTADRTYALGAWVELSAEGRVERVTLPEDTSLPAVLHAPVVQKVGAITFEPAQVGGVSRPSRSWLQARLRLVPAGDNYVLEIETPALGPRPIEHFKPRVGPPPDLPVRVLLSFAVTSDGRVENVEVVPFDRPPNGSRFAADLILAAKRMRFEPEQVDGERIATNLRWPVQVRRSTDPEKPFELPPVARDPSRPGAPGQDAYASPVIYTAVRQSVGIF